MSDNGNMGILKNYLVEKKNAYLLDDNNNGKTIMLSGKWGSGKTHFWEKKILPALKEKKKANAYVSLYGKTSREEVEADLFMQIYKSIEGESDFISKACSSFLTVGKSVGSSLSLGFSLASGGSINPDVEKISTVLDKFIDKDKLEQSKNFLNKGGIICFDDFERKSKDIDLNDLFGFISQLTIQFKCKVVIILNDDVFEGEEKDIFSRVKEKTVSKYLYFNPSIEELFEIIYNSDEKYKALDGYKEKILETIKETEELNARIYIQVLDNLFEWIENKEHNEDIVRCLILVNINFILYHTIFNKYEVKTNNNEIAVKLGIKNFNNLIFKSIGASEITLTIYEEYIVFLKNNIFNKQEKNYESNKNPFFKDRNLTELQISEKIKIIDDNDLIFRSLFYGNKFDIAKNLNEEIFQKINNFIETGILPNE